MAEPDDNAILPAFGWALRRLRRDREMSQDAVARFAGMSLNHYGEVERGRKELRLTTAAKLARTFDMPLSELIARAEVARPPPRPAQS